MRRLSAGNLKILGEKMFATHDALSKMYGVSCKELDFLIDQVRSKKEVISARMMGGGFGGCTINLVESAAIDALVSEIKPLYEQTMRLPLDYYITTIEDVTSIVQPG